MIVGGRGIVKVVAATTVVKTTTICYMRVALAIRGPAMPANDRIGVAFSGSKDSDGVQKYPLRRGWKRSKWGAHYRGNTAVVLD